MIFITGDVHGSIDISKLNSHNFPMGNELTKDDYLIVTGDFGLIWDNSNEEKYWQKWLQGKTFTTLFVDGNHENHDMLDKMKVSIWNGGKVHYINDSVIHLMRGQVFTIDNKKIFTFGGAESIDKANRTTGKSWWKREMPSNGEYEEGFNNLEKHNYKVDYVITHDCSQSIFEKIMEGLWVKNLTPINKYFEVIEEKLDYKQWYFGHYHEDKQVDLKHRLIYLDVKLL